jgi:hypothetical protein
MAVVYAHILLYLFSAHPISLTSSLNSVWVRY